MAEQDDYRQINFYVDHSKQVNDGFASFKEEGGEYYFAYKSKGTIYLMSEGYSSDRARSNGIQSVEKNIKIKDRFKMMEPNNGQHYFVLKAGNNQEIAKSRFFKNEAEAQSAITMLIASDVKLASNQLANIKIDAPLPPKEASKKKRKKRSSEKKPEVEKVILSEGKYPRAGITYQIFRSGNQKHYFTFRTPDEKAVLLNANVTGFKTEAEAISKVDEVIKFGAKQANYEGKTTRNGKYYFYLKNEEGKSIAKSFFFESPEALQAGVALLSSDTAANASPTSANATIGAAQINKPKESDSKAKEELKILEANAIKAKENEKKAKEESDKAYKAELARVKAEQEAKEKAALASKQKEEDEASKQKESAISSNQTNSIADSNASAADDLMATLGKKNIPSDTLINESSNNNNLSNEEKIKAEKAEKEKAERESIEKEKAAKLKAEKEAKEKAEAEKKLKELEASKAATKRKEEAEAAALAKVKAEKEKAEKLAAEKLATEKAAKEAKTKDADINKEIKKETIVKNIDGSASKDLKTTKKEHIEKPIIEEKSKTKTPLVFGDSKKEATPLVFGESKKEATPLEFGSKETTTKKTEPLTFGKNDNKKKSKELSFGTSKTIENNTTVTTAEVTKRKFPWWLIPLLLIPFLLFFLWKGCSSGAADNAVVATKEKTKAVTKKAADITKQASKTATDKVVAAKDVVSESASKTADATKNAAEQTKKAVVKAKDKVVETTKASSETITETATVATSVSQFESGTIEHAINRCINDNNCYTPASINWGETNYSKNSARISSAATGSINNLALLMQTYPNVNLAIYGHISNNESDYIENSSTSLSERRAKKMYDMLVANGIGSSRLSYQGMGNSKPIDYGDSANSDYKNRRTEVVLTSK